MSEFARLALVYTALRIVLFVACLVVLYVLGLRSFVLVAVALLASGVIAYPVARKQRDRLTAAYEERRRR